LEIAEPGVAQIAHAIGAQKREISVGIDAEHMRVGVKTFGVAQADLFGRADYMAVGQHQSIGRDHDAGAEPAALARVARFRAGFHAHDGRPDALGHADHGIGIGIEEVLVVVRSGFGGGGRQGGLR
jgi:hypothetical protein